MTLKYISHILSALLLMSAVGCGNGLSTLSGTVRIDGQPAPKGISLEFIPVAAGGSPSYCTTDAEGNYEAAFTFREMGIQPGQHRVRMVPGGSGPGGESRMPEIGPDGKPVLTEPVEPKKFPDSYFQEIQKIQVESGSNKIDIELVTETEK